MDPARQIAPTFGDNLKKNSDVLVRIRNIVSLASGTGAGILRLESLDGFLFYLAVSVVVSILIFGAVAKASPKTYFASASDVWLSNVFSGLSGFVLTWTLFYGLVDA